MINHCIQQHLMRGAVLGISLILMLVPFSEGFSQDSHTQLDVFLQTPFPYVYQDIDGHTVVVGTVENTNQLSAVTNVFIHVSFFGDTDQHPLEYALGNTTLDVIPPGKSSTFVVRSENPNPEITEVSVRLLTFDLAEAKKNYLTVSSTDVVFDNTFRFSGILQNGAAPTSENRVHLAFYDAFEPPRMLSVSTVNLGSMEPNTEVAFEYEGMIDSRTVGFLLFAESDTFYSDAVDVRIPPQQLLTKLVTIHDVSAADESGAKMSEADAGSAVTISSSVAIQRTGDQDAPTLYKYYVQVKESGTSPAVVFLDVYEGVFDGTAQSPSVVWTPEEPGLFIIETFVWDENNIPITNNGPIALFVVV